MDNLTNLFRRSAVDPRPDGELLAAFLADHDDRAFAELVRRHGQLVWGVCRRALNDTSDAEDAFQATFLVLVRRARRLINTASIGPWLYKVASWTTTNVRRKNALYHARFAELPDAVPDRRPSSELVIDIDTVLLGLPERYRQAVIMCCLTGMTHREAADQLGCAEGTVSSLISRGLAKLRTKLAGRDPAAILAIAVMSVPAGITAATVRSAVSLRLASLATTASPAVAALTQGVLRMFWIKKVATIGFAAALLIAVGIGVGMSKQVGSVANGQEKSELKKAESPVRPLTTPKTAEPISENGEIVGRLIDAVTGKPVAGATIACGAVFMDSGQAGGSDSVTDAEGRYRLKVPSPGIYNVWLEKLDKQPTKTAVADDGILVEAGKVSASKLHLQEGRKIEGKVVNSDGGPTANIEVYCYSAARPQTGAVQSAITKDDGTFEFFLPPGQAYVYVVQHVKKAKLNPGEIPSIESFAHADLKVSATEDITPIKLTLQAWKLSPESKPGDTGWLNRSTPGTQIVRRLGNQDVTGTVVDASGKPIEGALVFRKYGPTVTTNEKGEFRVEAIRSTQFVMHAFKPGHHLWFGTPTSGDMLKIVLEPKPAPIPAKEKPKADPPVKGAKVWPHFTKVVGDDKAARELFDRIVANPANLAILEKTTTGDPNLLKTYLARRNELNAATDWFKNPPPDEIAAWLLLGTYPGTTRGDDTLLRFLDMELAPIPLFVDAAGVDAMGTKSPVGQPLRKLVAVWLANHSDEFSAVKAGLELSGQYDIPEPLAIARRVIKGITGTKLDHGPQVNSSLMLRGLGMLVIGKYGSKDDVALLQPYFKDGSEFYAVIREKPGERRPGYAVPIEGKDVTIQVGDVALAMAIHLRGGDPREFRFLWPTALDGMKITGPYRLGMIGFISTTDRTAAHKKAKEWLEKPPM